ncbi:hypothetical protein PoB_005535600 [Plakobranchus ocellatus]|uniref:Uncharacterized protein n=1 Tax=Plakobranchus ocellatus TaxID=259542 RepID=A0AAV4C829_9GAST|nr:hypothetical protein PoB_005535600 [Plakobranchus ocellatus]
MGIFRFDDVLKYITALLLLSHTLVYTAQGCKTNEIASNCPDFDVDVIIKGDFWAGFIPTSELDIKCQMYQDGLNCALRDEHVKDCSPKDIAVFSAHKNVLDMVCTKYRYAYLQGQQCFTQRKVQTAGRIKRFKRKGFHGVWGSFLYGGLGCGVPNGERGCVEDARYCARDFVDDHRIQGCEQQDVKLLATMVDEFLRPFSDVQCEWEEIETDGVIATPATVATGPSTTEASAETTSSSSDIDSSTQPEKVGRSRNSSSAPDAAKGVLSLSLLLLLALCLLR